MRSLVKAQWNPFPELRSLQSHFNRLLDETGRVNFDEDLVNGNWVPAVDVAEEPERLMVRAELPGMKQEDIDIRFEGGLLTIRGERKFENEKNERNYHRIERAYGTFSRSFTLPRTVDADEIVASYDDGILEIVIPKRDEAKPKQIKIAVHTEK